MPVEKRPDRRIIRFSGPDAGKLLGDVLTGEFAAENAEAHWWALLSPQGKIQADGLAGWYEDAFWLDVHESVTDAFIKRMKLYRLRAAVDIADVSDTHHVGWSPDNISEANCHQDVRANEMGYRVIASAEDAKDWTSGNAALSRRISNGIVEVGADYATDKLFPHDMAMDILGGIDFEKGCYVGQEVVSRMKHRGTARRRPVLVAGTQLTNGTEISVNGRGVGNIGPALDDQAVAIVRLDRVTDDGEQTTDGNSIALALPEWASYRFGDSGTGT